MIKANTRYIAEEILTEAGINAEDVIGKMRVLIGGLTVSALEQVIRIPATTESIEIVTGVDSVSLDIEEENEEQELSVGVQEIENAKADEAIAIDE